MENNEGKGFGISDINLKTAEGRLLVVAIDMLDSKVVSLVHETSDQILERIKRRAESVFTDTFDIPKNGFDFAINALKEGKKVCRQGWNGKGMWLKLVDATEYRVEIELGHPRQLSWIGMKTADDCFVPWLASQTDMLAKDWGVID